MLAGDRAVLMDFGIAKAFGASLMTKTGSVVGTFQYIAPEQIRGADDIDGRADVYALAVMTYQMLVGALPFEQHNPEALLIAHLNPPPPDPRAVQPDVPREGGTRDSESDGEGPRGSIPLRGRLRRGSVVQIGLLRDL